MAVLLAAGSSVSGSSRLSTHADVLLQTTISNSIPPIAGIPPLHSNWKSKNRQHAQRLCRKCRLSGLQIDLRSSSGSRHKRRLESPQASLQMDSSVKQNREWGDLERPDWSGDSLLSKVVNMLIGITPLYSLMKAGARQLMVSTAEKNGVPWRQRYKELETSDVYKELELIEDKSIVYPDYYLQPFHAYEKGNLCWQAAFEVDSASASIMLRGVPQASSVEEATAYLRGNWLERIREHHGMHSGGLPVKTIVDIGCATGISTRFLADKFESAQEVVGVDLSPYFLAVAQFKDRQAQEAGQAVRPIQWKHARGESTGLPAESADIVSLAFILHECPDSAARDLIREAKRLLRPGGTIAITDNSPRSKLIQSLPAPVYTLMKSTEPWSDEFYGRNLVQILTEEGFREVEDVLTDARHCTVTGTVV